LVRTATIETTAVHRSGQVGNKVHSIQRQSSFESETKSGVGIMQTLVAFERESERAVMRLGASQGPADLDTFRFVGAVEGLTTSTCGTTVR
jgi:hypothetical protein